MYDLIQAFLISSKEEHHTIPATEEQKQLT